eukprot:15240983-Ditylum_brightwellii.AAC.1
MVELSEEKSSQKPPADATALNLADIKKVMTQGLTQVNNTRKNGMDIDDDLWKRENTQDKHNNGKDNAQTNTVQREKIKSKKRFHPTT